VGNGGWELADNHANPTLQHLICGLPLSSPFGDGIAEYCVSVRQDFLLPVTP
jgi:hypothetical protein